jgi:tetratricopeptide (TPR) repeat protein
MIRPRPWAIDAAVFLALLSLAGLAGAQATDEAASTDAAATESAATQAADNAAPAEPTVEQEVRLLDREPFDRVTLDAANDNAVIETVLLELSDRRVPDPLPESGELSLRRLSEPSIPYVVSWSAIEKIELYEQMLLAEAERLTAANNFAEAFEYLAFLSANYPQLPGLESARQSHLWREASTDFAAGRRDEAWSVLQALYQRNPAYPRLANAVQSVSDDMISGRLEERDYNAARAVMSALEKSFPELKLQNIARWQARFQADANAAMERAQAAYAAERYSEARAAVNQARAIMPSTPGAEELWNQIQTTAPEIRIGVMQAAGESDPQAAPTWATARTGLLTEPPLVAMVDFSAEGGVYRSNWAEISTSDDGLETTIAVSPLGLKRGLLPGVIALQLVEMGAAGDHGSQDFSAVLHSVRIANGNEVVVRWRQPPIKPAALLQLPLRRLIPAARSAGMWFDAVGRPSSGKERIYQRAGQTESAAGEAKFIVEQFFDSDDAALAALMSGDIDVVDRVPPWQLERLESADDIVVGEYRMPTIHVLVPNFANPLVETREFRRALCYGIDSESIVRDLITAGKSRAGFRTLSGPFPAGAALSDPVGYAYNNELPPRPYEPRLAALLSGVARKTLAKLEAEAKKKAAAAQDKSEASEVPDESGASSEKPKDNDLPPPEALVLAHTTDPVARLACQTIKIQLDGVGIPVRLAEFEGNHPPQDMKFDLLYAEVAVWEPLVDARKLLGLAGLAGRASPLMVMALDELATSQNWNDARTRLKEIHRIAHYDLPVIPLWQTVNYFAHRKSIQGIGESPVALYQNLSAWRKTFE